MRNYTTVGAPPSVARVPAVPDPVLAGKTKPDSGEVHWGITTTQTYFPKDNAEYFRSSDLSLVDWLRQFSDEKTETFIRGFLGRMLS